MCWGGGGGRRGVLPSGSEPSDLPCAHDGRLDGAFLRGLLKNLILCLWSKCARGRCIMLLVGLSRDYQQGSGYQIIIAIRTDNRRLFGWVISELLFQILETKASLF